jgi:hypothetical protein
MLCAHTVRRLTPGSFEEFAERFAPREEDAPAGWVRFHILRSLADENEVVTFGFFDGTLEELERSQRDLGYQDRRASIDPLVDAVVSNGVYEIAGSLVVEEAARA